MKHEGSCKNMQKKRKVFDMSKQRVTEDISLKQIKNAQKKVTLVITYKTINYLFTSLKILVKSLHSRHK